MRNILRGATSRLGFDPKLVGLRATVVAIAATLLSAASTIALTPAAHRDGALLVLIVVISMTMARTQLAASDSDRLLGLALLPLCTAVACEIRALMADTYPVEEILGDGLFCLAVAATVWVRRFGPRGPAVGRLAVAPLVATLISPVTIDTAVEAGWAGLAAAVALGWIWLLPLAARGTGFLVPPASPRPAAMSTAGRGGTRWSAPTRLAVQMAAALAAAFLVGRAALGGHWAWVVLTAFVVCSGNRGRGDVVHKSALRVLGGIGGTATATGLVSLFGTHSAMNLVAAFVALVVASWLRAASYAWWAGGITAMLAFGYGYLGQSGLEPLLERLAGIVLGGLIGVAASWLILPIRTTDAVRRRLNAALGLLAELLTGLRAGADLTGVAARYGHAVAALELVSPPLTALRRLPLRRRTSHPLHRLADAGTVPRRCLEPVRLLTERARSAPRAAWSPRATELLNATEATLTTARASLARPAGGPEQADGAVHGLDDQLADLAAALAGPAAP